MKYSNKSFIERYGQYIDRMPEYSTPYLYGYNDGKYNVSLFFKNGAYCSLVKQQIDTKIISASESDIAEMLGVDEKHG